MELRYRLLEIYVSGIKFEKNQKEENGITYPPEWKNQSGNLLPLEFEAYLPKEGMTPDQALEQLNNCSSLAEDGKTIVTNFINKK